MYLFYVDVSIEEADILKSPLIFLFAVICSFVFYKFFFVFFHNKTESQLCVRPLFERSLLLKAHNDIAQNAFVLNL